MGNLTMPRSVMSAASAPSAIAYHAAMADGWDNRYRKNSFRSRMFVLEECLAGHELKGTSWLDAGCGSGVLSRWLAEHGCTVHGVDAAAEMVEVAANLANENGRSRQMSFGRIETIADLPLQTESADGVLCSSVLEYVDDPAQCIHEFARVLKPNGLLLVSVPNRHSLFRKAQIAAHWIGHRIGAGWLEFLDYSRHEYRIDDFVSLLSDCGLETERVVAFGSVLPRGLQRWRFGGSLLMFLARKSS